MTHKYWLKHEVTERMKNRYITENVNRCYVNTLNILIVSNIVEYISLKFNYDTDFLGSPWGEQLTDIFFRKLKSTSCTGAIVNVKANSIFIFSHLTREKLAVHRTEAPAELQRTMQWKMHFEEVFRTLVFLNSHQWSLEISSLC